MKENKTIGIAYSRKHKQITTERKNKTISFY